MKYYEDFLKLGCFTFKQAVKLVGLETTTRSLLQQYIKKGYVMNVRKGLYVTVNLLDNEPVANKFLIASNIDNTAFVSHHSAFEYHGCANQVSYDVTVTSSKTFTDFDFNGFHFTRHKPTILLGIIVDENGIRVTDIERTVLDCIDDFENNMGFEELLQCISSVPILSEDKILRYLKEYDRQFMYQKTGFILEYFKDEFSISDEFFKICKNKIGSSSRYLIKNTNQNSVERNGYWQLTIPKNLWDNMTGGDMYAEI